MAQVGVGGVTGLGAQHLLEDQHVAGLQMGECAEESGFGCAFGQAAIGVAPGVEVDQVVFGIEHRILHGLEDDHPGLQSGFLIARAGSEIGRHSGGKGVEAGLGLIHQDLHGDLELQPRAGIAAVVDEVVHQTGMTAERDAAARGFNVGFRGYRVLLVAEVVARVGDQLGHGDADVGLGRSAPGGNELIEAIEQDGAEGAVILGQVIDGRRRGRLRRTVGRLGRAIEVGAALDLEGELNLGQLRIESGQGFGDLERVFGGLRGAVHQSEKVGREIACGAGADDQDLGCIG
jgi:hypothetical protein